MNPTTATTSLSPEARAVHQAELALADVQPRRRRPVSDSCVRCGGTGEVATARSVGGGAVNDDYDTCPTCNGVGRAPVRRSAIGVALLDALHTAVVRGLEHGPQVAKGRLETARAALIAYGYAPEHVAACEEGITIGWREAQQPWATNTADLTPLEVERLR